MSEGVLEFTPRIETLKAISPSRFTALQECALREVWSASQTPQLLPSSPSARLGSIIHRLLQEAGEGRLINCSEARIDHRLQELIKDAEQVMLLTWLERHLVPLSGSIPDFEVRCIRTRKRALEISETISHVDKKLSTPRSREKLDHGFELPMSSPDGTVQAKIDAVLPSPEGAVLKDYKSGAIFADDSELLPTLKVSYEKQLMLYAALYAASKGRWPVRLELVPLTGIPCSVAFNRSDCSLLLEEASEVLQKVNSTIKEAVHAPQELIKRLGAPSPTNCAYCPYRPGCGPYRSTVSKSEILDDWPKDLWGRLGEIRQLGNGKLLITIQRKDDLRQIRAVTPGQNRHPALQLLKVGEALAVFNLRAGGSKEIFLETSYTVIYKMPDGNDGSV
jgi:hypothetical protein